MEFPLAFTRREFIKSKAAAAAASVAGASLTASAVAAVGGDGIRWDKGVCR
jgi:nitrate reductase NapA